MRFTFQRIVVGVLLSVLLVQCMLLIFQKPTSTSTHARTLALMIESMELLFTRFHSNFTTLDQKEKKNNRTRQVTHGEIENSQQLPQLKLSLNSLNASRSQSDAHFPRIVRRAFVTMICATQHSTFDRNDGLGSSVAALAHGYIIKRLQNPAIESVLMHVTGGACMNELPLEVAIRSVYDKIVRTDGSSRLETMIRAKRWKMQPHLWLKLLALNLTAYDTVMWLGYDTLPLVALDAAFDCKPTPCIDQEGNADMMVFTPDPSFLNRMTTVLEEGPGGRSNFDGYTGYDQGFMHAYLPRMVQRGFTPIQRFMKGTCNRFTPVLKEISLPNKHFLFGVDRNIHIVSKDTAVIHFTWAAKPWFQIYCKSLPKTGLTPDGPGVGYVCDDVAVPTTEFFVFWNVVLQSLKGNHKSADLKDETVNEVHGDENIAIIGHKGTRWVRKYNSSESTWRSSMRNYIEFEFGLKENLSKFKSQGACSLFLAAWPGMREWCPTNFTLGSGKVR
jgi:hypothetical protein